MSPGEVSVNVVEPGVAPPSVLGFKKQFAEMLLPLPTQVKAPIFTVAPPVLAGRTYAWLLTVPAFFTVKVPPNGTVIDVGETPPPVAIVIEADESPPPDPLDTSALVLRALPHVMGLA